MEYKVVSISNGAKKFISENNIKHVTFNLSVIKPSGACCLKIVKEIEPVYQSAENLAQYYQFEIQGLKVYVARQLKIYAPIKIRTEGFYYFKRLTLSGVTVGL